MVTVMSPQVVEAAKGAAGLESSLWRLEKYEALGNDFLVIFLEEGPAAGFGREPGFLAAWAESLCHRHRGVGADGLLALWVRPGRASTERGHGQGNDPMPSSSLAPEPVVSMTLWNADGTLAETSGNGLRVSAHAVTRGYSATKAPFVILTAAGPRVVRSVAPSQGRAGEVLVSVDMGAPVVEAFDDEVRAALWALVPWPAVFVDVGNPHVVLLGEGASDLAELDLAELAGQVYQVLGREVNLEVAVPGEGGRFGEDLDVGSAVVFSIRVHERGVGETEACGSGSVAVAKALDSLGVARGSVKIVSSGGSLIVDWEDGRAWLTGPSRWVASLEVPGPLS